MIATISFGPCRMILIIVNEIIFIGIKFIGKINLIEIWPYQPCFFRILSFYWEIFSIARCNKSSNDPTIFIDDIIKRSSFRNCIDFFNAIKGIILLFNLCFESFFKHLPNIKNYPLITAPHIIHLRLISIARFIRLLFIIRSFAFERIIKCCVYPMNCMHFIDKFEVHTFCFRKDCTVFCKMIWQIIDIVNFSKATRFCRCLHKDSDIQWSKS